MRNGNKKIYINPRIDQELKRILNRNLARYVNGVEDSLMKAMSECCIYGMELKIKQTSRNKSLI